MTWREEDVREPEDKRKGEGQGDNGNRPWLLGTLRVLGDSDFCLMNECKVIHREFTRGTHSLHVFEVWTESPMEVRSSLEVHTWTVSQDSWIVSTWVGVFDPLVILDNDWSHTGKHWVDITVLVKITFSVKWRSSPLSSDNQGCVGLTFWFFTVCIQKETFLCQSLTFLC